MTFLETLTEAIPLKKLKNPETIPRIMVCQYKVYIKWSVIYH